MLASLIKQRDSSCIGAACISCTHPSAVVAHWIWRIFSLPSTDVRIVSYMTGVVKITSPFGFLLFLFLFSVNGGSTMHFRTPSFNIYISLLASSTTSFLYFFADQTIIYSEFVTSRKAVICALGALHSYHTSSNSERNARLLIALILRTIKELVHRGSAEKWIIRFMSLQSSVGKFCLFVVLFIGTIILGSRLCERVWLF